MAGSVGHVQIFDDPIIFQKAVQFMVPPVIGPDPTGDFEFKWDAVNSRVHLRDAADAVYRGFSALDLCVGGGYLGGNPPAGISVYCAESSNLDPRGIMSAQYSDDAVGARLHFRKARGTEAAPTVVVTADVLGRVRFSGYDGANYLQMASIDAISTGTIAATRVPTYLSFSVATDAAPSVLTEVFRLSGSQIVTQDGSWKSTGSLGSNNYAQFFMQGGPAAVAGIGPGVGGVRLSSGGTFSWSSANADGGTADVIITRDAANILAQRNGVNAQAFRIYNTFTDASNYERGVLSWASNILRIGTENAGTGSGRAIYFATASTDRWSITSGGSLTALSDNTYDIGLVGATRPRSIYVGTSFLAPDGAVGAPGYSWASATNLGYYVGAANQIWTSVSGVATNRSLNNGFLQAGSLYLGWETGAIGSGVGVTLFQDAANIIGQRNGTNAQALRIYNTFTDGSNYERARIAWITNVLWIGSEAAGSGAQRGVNIDGTTVNLAIGGTNKWGVSSTGHFIPITDNQNDFGVAATQRIRDLYLNGSAGGNASAGAIGEYISSTIVAGSAVALTTATSVNMTSISLTAGDWEVDATIALQFGATTSYTNLSGGIGTVTNTLPSQENMFDFEAPATVPTAGKDMSFVLPTVRISINATTTIYCVAQCTFTVSTLKAYGILRARRVR